MPLAPPSDRGVRSGPHEGRLYRRGPGVRRASRTRRRERRPGDPLTRPLRVFVPRENLFALLPGEAAVEAS
jgi:hypothetical protein